MKVNLLFSTYTLDKRIPPEFERAYKFLAVISSPKLIDQELVVSSMLLSALIFIERKLGIYLACQGIYFCEFNIRNKYFLT